MRRVGARWQRGYIIAKTFGVGGFCANGTGPTVSAKAVQCLLSRPRRAAENSFADYSVRFGMEWCRTKAERCRRRTANVVSNMKRSRADRSRNKRLGRTPALADQPKIDHTIYLFGGAARVGKSGAEGLRGGTRNRRDDS